MNRRITNLIRYIMDEWIPPVIRDSRWFMYPFYFLAYRGRDISTMMNFKEDYFTWDDKQLQKFYQNLNSISRNRPTDLNKRCLEMILKELDGKYQDVLDVGCSTGYVLSIIHEKFPSLTLTGVDFKTNEKAGKFRLVNADVRKLPFEDKSFDVVICSHTIEHIFEIDQFITELKRVARTKVVIVTPRQRYYFYTLDEHLQFFPRAELLTSRMAFDNFTCEDVDGDWFYTGSF